jgi:hypothetical protein
MRHLSLEIEEYTPWKQQRNATKLVLDHCASDSHSSSYNGEAVTLHSRKLFLPLSYQLLLLIVISVIYLLHFQHLSGSGSKKHKKYMNCHEHIGTIKLAVVVARWPHGCRRKYSEVAVPMLVGSNPTEGGGFFQRKEPPPGHGCVCMSPRG